MSDTTISRYRSAIVAVAPVVMLAAALWHPHIPGRLPNDAAVATAVAAGTTRWGLAHLAASIASGLVILAFIAIHSHLREAGETRWSVFALPFIVIGSILYALLPGLEFAPLVAVETGTDAQEAQAALEPWFVSVLVSGAITFAIGAFACAKAVAHSAILSPGLTRLVVVALIAMAASRLVPVAAFQFYVQGVAALVAFWPLADGMLKRSPGLQTRPVPAS